MLQRKLGRFEIRGIKRASRAFLTIRVDKDFRILNNKARKRVWLHLQFLDKHLQFIYNFDWIDYSKIDVSLLRRFRNVKNTTTFNH